MFERFTREARAVVERAQEEALALGAPAVEAEHLLLALARTDPALAAAGLDHEGTLAALESAFERSLAAVGVSVDDLGGTTARTPPARPKFGTTAKRALELSLRISLERADRRIGPGHVLLGVLRAQEGTVARALAAAGVDRDELADRVVAAM